MRTLTSLLLLALLGAAPAAAQGPSSDRADALQQSAEALLDQPGRYDRAARLLVRSADLRAAEDSETFQSLRLASRLFAYSGQLGSAVRTASAAAEIALRNGALLDAGHALLDAASLELMRRNPDAAHGFVNGAERIAESPHLTDDERRELMQRVAQPGTPVAAR